MVKKKGFFAKDLIARTILAVVIVVIGLSLAGCGDKMAKMEDRQLRLEAMVEANNHQITAMATSIERSQQELQAGIEAVRDNIRQVAADFVTIAEEQTRLHKALQNSNQQAGTRMAAIERDQRGLQAGIEQTRSERQQAAAEIADLTNGHAKLCQTVDSDSRRLTGRVVVLEQNQHELQAGIEDVRDGTLKVAADVTAVRDEQTRLYGMVENNGRQLTDNAAVIEQNRQAWQTTIEDIQDNIQQVAAKVGALGANLVRLEDILQTNVRDLTGLVNGNGRGQAELQEKMQRDLSALDGSVSAIRQNQNRLQGQIETVQNNAEILINEMPAAIERLRDELLNRMAEAEAPSSYSDADGTE
ncbi:MAG: hypothetical protein ABIF19_01605 [Planctomycetota bacterium]